MGISVRNARYGGRMRLPCRLLRLRPWPPAAGGPVVLRHAPSGQVLTDGSADAAPVCFPSAAAARAFRARWLDEADGWEVAPVAGEAERAA